MVGVFRRNMNYGSTADTTQTSGCDVCDPCIQFEGGLANQTEFDKWFETVAGTTQQGVVANQWLLDPGSIVISRSFTQSDFQRMWLYASPVFNGFNWVDGFTVYLDWVDSSNYHAVDYFFKDLSPPNQVWRSALRYYRVAGGSTEWELEKITHDFDGVTVMNPEEFCFQGSYISVSDHQSAFADSSFVSSPHGGNRLGFGAPSSNTFPVPIQNFAIWLGPDTRRHYTCPGCVLACPECAGGATPAAFIVEITGMHGTVDGTHRLEMDDRPFGEDGCPYSIVIPAGTITLVVRNEHSFPSFWPISPVPWTFELRLPGSVAGGGDNVPDAIDNGLFNGTDPNCLTLSNIPLTKRLHPTSPTTAEIQDLTAQHPGATVNISSV